MKAIAYVVLLCVICLVLPMAAAAQRIGQPSVRIEGTYERFTVGKKSGDLEGMRVILIDGGGWIYAIVQRAQGGAELPEPVLTRVNVKGTDINFSVKFPGQDQVERFLGRVSTTGLRLRTGDPLRPSFLGPLPGKEKLFLKRKRC